MNTYQYIKSRFQKVLNESLNEKANSILNKLNYDDETPFHPAGGSFDYVQEGKSMCEQCGGVMKEGECSECGYNNEGVEIMELGGMDDGHPRFGNKNFAKMSRREKEDLMSDRSYEYSDDKEDFIDDFDDEDDFRFNAPSSDYDFEEDEDDFRFNAPLPDDMPLHKTKYRYSDDEEITEKLHGKQHRLDKNKNGRLDSEDFRMLRRQQDEEQLYEVKFEKEVEEGNKFANEVNKAKLAGKKTFKFDGKTFPVKESYITEKRKEIANSKSFESLIFSENELISFIENLVNEEKKFSFKEPKGYKEYERAHKADKKENDNYLNSVAKKITNYLKGVSDKGSKWEMKQTQKFPTENGGLKKNIRKKYTPSDAVNDYIDAFSYPGQTNLVFDEIKPTEKNIEKYLKGHRTTGNAQVDDDGNALGNVVPSNVGDKFFQNFKDNLYGQEQMNASYKRQPQPVDQAGEETERGSLKTKRGKKTSQSVLNKIEESVSEKQVEKLTEEFLKIHKLMTYDGKTQ